MEEQLVVIKSH